MIVEASQAVLEAAHLARAREDAAAAARRARENDATLVATPVSLQILTALRGAERDLTEAACELGRLVTLLDVPAGSPCRRVSDHRAADWHMHRVNNRRVQDGVRSCACVFRCLSNGAHGCITRETRGAHGGVVCPLVRTSVKRALRARIEQLTADGVDIRSRHRGVRGRRDCAHPLSALSSRTGRLGLSRSQLLPSCCCAGSAVSRASPLPGAGVGRRRDDTRADHHHDRRRTAAAAHGGAVTATGRLRTRCYGYDDAESDEEWRLPRPKRCHTTHYFGQSWWTAV